MPNDVANISSTFLPGSQFGVQGTIGVAAKVSVVRLGAEYNVGRVSGYSFKVAFGS